MYVHVYKEQCHTKGIFVPLDKFCMMIEDGGNMEPHHSRHHQCCNDTLLSFTRFYSTAGLIVAPSDLLHCCSGGFIFSDRRQLLPLVIIYRLRPQRRVRGIHTRCWLHITARSQSTVSRSPPKKIDGSRIYLPFGCTRAVPYR